MSKEWLEEISKLLVNLYNAVDVVEEMKHYIFNDLKIEWLIEQAERVQELEKENRRYREALEFYADDKSWEFDWLDDIRESLIWKDYGEKARQALE